MATVNVILTVLDIANDSVDVSATALALVVIVHFDPPNVYGDIDAAYIHCFSYLFKLTVFTVQDYCVTDTQKIYAESLCHFLLFRICISPSAKE